MSTYDRFMSSSFFREYTEEQVQSMTHTMLGIRRATNLVKRVLGLCKFKMGAEYADERYVDMLDYNAFYFSASYLYVTYPSTTTPERAMVSSVVITALEELVNAVNAAETVEELPTLACAKFVNAMEMHIATFGKRLPISREEKIFRILAHYEEVATGNCTPVDLPVGVRARYNIEYQALREKLIGFGLENEMRKIDDQIAKRLSVMNTNIVEEENSGPSD
jgi:hypothetical protein